MTPAKSQNGNRAEKRDHRREVTDSIIKMLEDGVQKALDINLELRKYVKEHAPK